MHQPRKGSRVERSGSLGSSPANRRTAVALTVFMALMMILGQASIAFSGELGAASSGSAVANSGGGAGSGGSGSSVGSTSTSSGAEAPTVVRPTGTVDSGPSHEDLTAKRRERRTERRQQRTPPEDHSVTICHATDSYSNPYVVNTPDISSSGHLSGGHDTEHEGPVFYDGITEKWGDIIPPYKYTNADGTFTYPGQNWTAEGQAIWESGPHKRACALPKVYSPSIDVTKTCPASAGIGETISYSITVKNTGDEPLEDVVVNDPLLGGNLGVFPGTLDEGASVTKTFSYTVKAGDPDPLKNTVTATATGSFSGDNVSDSDACQTDITHNPGIMVTKTCPASAKIGEEITYTITVKNTGDEPLKDVVVSDPLLGAIGGSFPNTLNVGQSASADFKYTVTDSTPDPLVNEVTATGTGVDSSKNVADSDKCTTDIVHEPGIDVTKSCTPSAKIGDKITWDITVTNTGNEPLENVTVDDTILGDISGSYPDTFAVGQTETRSFDHVVTPADLDPVHNEVTAKGTGADSGKDVSDTAECDTDIIHQPAIEVTKSCTPAVKIGEDITYSITVKNTGDEPLQNVTVNDSILGDISGSYSDTFAVGQTETQTFTYTVTASDTDPVHNVVTAAGKGADSGETVSDQDTCDTDIVHEPKIDVEKSCTPNAGIGDTVTWTITVTNVGDEPLKDVTVNDSILGDVSSDFPDTLAVGASASKDFTHTVTAADPPLIHNEVTATGVGTDSGKSTSDTDSCDTTVTQNPAISIEKDGPALAHVGEEITYTFVVDNVGDVPLHDVTVVDPKCDTGPSIVSKDGGNNDDILEVDAETWTYSCTHVVTAGDPDPLPNTGTATGVSPHDETVSDQDDHLVDLIHPAIDIVKTVNNEVGHAGETVTYTYVVTNTGDTTLYNVTVDDDVMGHIGDIASLAPGASAALTADYTLGDVGVVNVATAYGCDVADECVTDEDDASVTVIAPAIDIVKTVDQLEGNPGDVVTYTYVVTNTGDTTLYNVTVDDDIIGHIGDIASLDPGASETLTADYTLGDPGVVTNVVITEGCDVLNLCVDAQAFATVTVVEALCVGAGCTPRTPPEGKILPFTGSQATPFAIAIMALLAAGAAFALAARRRRDEA